ncbi:hypothetical protein SERLA73DRAFT_44943, partial [Serpula lacrymans var. lacrymans S7.3]
FYNCCPRSCICYTGLYALLDAYPTCNSPRCDSKGTPCKRFLYIILIPCLISFLRNPGLAKKMQYKSQEHKHEPGVIKDTIEGRLYRNLLDQPVIVDGKDLGHNLFSDHRDIVFN